MPHTRVAQGTEVEFDLVQSPLAAYAHLVRVLLGLEWRQGEFGRLPNVPPPLVPLAAVAAAVAFVWRVVPVTSEAAPAVEAGLAAGAGAGDAAARRRARRDGPRARARAGAGERRAARARRPAPRALVVGVVWALVATLPVAAVAILWSAYYYLYAMCGVAVVIGVLLARRPVAWALAVLVALAWGSASARSLGEFAVARDPWTPQSHINRHYIERSNRIVDEYLASLQRAYPVLPKGSTLFFAGLKGNVAFQRANGPLLRWAYRDSSLRSYYLYGFSRDKLGRGPVKFFVAAGDTLRELEAGEDLYLRLASGMIASEQPEGARDALAVAEGTESVRPLARYWRAWTEWALGDTAAAAAWLRAAGYNPDPGPAPEREAALAAVAGGDTAAALALMRDAVPRHALDPYAHALLADLLLIRDREDATGVMEAYAARVLAPADPYAWRRWAMIQADRGRHLQALASFEKYFELGGQAVAGDAEAAKWLADIRAMLPGGDLAPEEIRR
jgi:tetratricopeptide (TPR) repeat protein